MEILGIFLITAAILIALFFIALLICFRMAFYSPKRKIMGENDFPIPKGAIYEPYRESMIKWMKETRALAHEEMSVTSFDGLTLRGKFYLFSPEAPIELMFHGYRGNAERDLCGAVQRCYRLGHSALIVDQRAGGTSDGNVISFGVNESRDCHTWINFMINHFGKDVKIMLTGISMGAATVLIAAGSPLPENVVGVLADCGYSSAPDIIKKVIREMKLPCNLLYPLVRISGKIFGGFDIENASPEKAVKSCTVPIILIHGEEDDFVPCEMSRKIQQNCTVKNTLFTVPNAGHGLSYLKDKDGYLKTVKEFWTEEGIYK